MPAFDDAVFVWDPDPAGDGSAPSEDIISSTAASELTEGAIVTRSYLGQTRTGRTYESGEGSRFVGVAPVDLLTDFTIMNVVRRSVLGVSNDGVGTAFWTGDRTAAAFYFLHKLQTTGGQQIQADHRIGGSSHGTERVIVNHSWSPDDDPHVLITTASYSGTTATVTMYLDGTQIATASGTITNTMTPDTTTIGREDDSSPASSTGIDVYAGAAWDRLLDSSEIAEVTADPFNDPTVPDAPTNPTATAQDSESILIGWDNVADETGYRVERSLDGSTGWTNVSGTLAADTVTYTDTGLDPETEYFYRVFAINAQGDSAASSTVNATTTAASSGNVIGGTGAIRRPPIAPRLAGGR